MGFAAKLDHKAPVTGQMGSRPEEVSMAWRSEPFNLGSNPSSANASLRLGQMTQSWIFHLYLEG